MKWLLTEDEDILTGFLLGMFFLAGIFVLLFYQDLFFVPFIFLAIWIYALIKRDKVKKQKQQNNSV